MSCSPGHLLVPLTLSGSLERIIREVAPTMSLDYLPSKAVQWELDISDLWYLCMHTYIYIFTGRQVNSPKICISHSFK